MPEQAAPEAVARLRVGLGREVDPRLVADPVLSHESLIQPGTERAVGHPLVRDAHDVAVAEPPQVLERQLGSPFVVDVYPGHTAALDPVTHSDDIAVATRQVFQGRIAALQVADDHDPVGMRLLEHGAVDRRHVGPVVDVAEEQPIAPCPRGDVDSAQDLEQERVGDVPDDDAQERAATPAQGPRKQVRLVAQLLGRGQNPLTRRLPDLDARFAAVQDPRGGRGRDAGPLRYVAQRDRGNGFSHLPRRPLRA